MRFADRSARQRPEARQLSRAKLSHAAITATDDLESTHCELSTSRAGELALPVDLRGDVQEGQAAGCRSAGIRLLGLDQASSRYRLRPRDFLLALMEVTGARGA